MADKALKEGGTDVCHGRSCDSQISNSGSYGYRKQQKSKGSPCNIRDKRGSDRFTVQSRVFQPRNGTLRQSGCGWEQQSSNQRPAHTPQKSQLRERKKSSAHSESLYPENGGYNYPGGKKKPSLNYLLNFTVAPGERRSSVGAMVGRRRRTGQSYNKEQFLQANCQFVVSMTGDYTIHSSDPDLLVDWDHIEQVRLFCHQISSCPICLYPPRAAKITRCGHVYCWSCVLHYLSLSDKKWRKCPICYESIYQKDLKSVTALTSHHYSVGDCLTMRLMARKKGTTLVLPREEWSKRKEGLITLQETSVSQFAKLLFASPPVVLSHITDPERKELQAQLASIDQDTASEACFVESALLELEARDIELRRAAGQLETQVNGDAGDATCSSKTASDDSVSSQSLSTQTSLSDDYFESSFEAPFLKKITGPATSSPPSEDSFSLDREDSPQPAESLGDGLDRSASINDNSLMSEDIDSDSNGHFESISQSPVSHCNDQARRLSQLTSDQDMIYFYQAADGQHLYLHSINAKCLMKEYGGLEFCPDEIQAKIVEIEELSLSEEMRSRYRWLGHLPLTCELGLVELDLRPPLLSRATLASFSDDISARRQRRMKKKKEERRRERKNEAKEKTPDPTFIVPSAHEMTPEVFHDLLSMASPTPPAGPVSSESPSSAPSFAQALQCKSPAMWPALSPPKAWSGNKPAVTSTKEESDPEEEGAVPTFSDAFNKALASASVSVMAARNVSGGKPGNKTAKKGRKKMVLFSTGSTRGTS